MLPGALQGSGHPGFEAHTLTSAAKVDEKAPRLPRPQTAAEAAPLSAKLSFLIHSPGFPSLNGRAAIGGTNPGTCEAWVEFVCGHCGGKSLWLVAVKQECLTCGKQSIVDRSAKPPPANLPPQS